MMPDVPQVPHPEQRAVLDTEREHSSIPRGGNVSKDGEVWVYPSQQMFFNAMKRKNWDAKEEDMKVVVPIHNAVNEMCWMKILEWEKMAKSLSDEDAKCEKPMLTKFQGKPTDMTPKARIRTLFGYTAPFDRHDWTVDRCGKEITYIIDFYSGKAQPNNLVSVYLDVRPKLDTWEGVKLRMAGLFKNKWD